MKQLVTKEEATKLSNICMKIKAAGFLPQSDLYEALGDELATKAIAILYRQFRLFREVNRPWKGTEVRGYEWANAKFNAATMKKIPPELGFVHQLSAAPGRYTDFKAITLHCRWISSPLAALPNPKYIKKKSEEKKVAEGNGHGELSVEDIEGEEFVKSSAVTSSPERIFERGASGPYIAAYCPRAMYRTALALCGHDSNIGYHIHCADIHFEEKAIIAHKRAMPRVGELIEEALPAGTEFTIEVVIPTSAISLQAWIELTHFAGKFVHLSPARSSGYGAFEVLRVE
jgi:hypothetical protein